MLLLLYINSGKSLNVHQNSSSSNFLISTITYSPNKKKLYVKPKKKIKILSSITFTLQRLLSSGSQCPRQQQKEILKVAVTPTQCSKIGISLLDNALNWVYYPKEKKLCNLGKIHIVCLFWECFWNFFWRKYLDFICYTYFHF